MDNQLAYIDQGSFLGLRALGREPLQHLAWVYSHELDMDALRRLHADLGRGLLGRRIERSPLPFGRHRWVAAPHQADLAVAARPMPRSELMNWLDEQAKLPVDPERGPAWRMTVQPFAEGGAAVSMVVSHSVGDGGATVLSIIEAVHGKHRELGYPAPRSRTRGRAVREDLSEIARAVPEMARAAAAAARLARAESAELRSSARRSVSSAARVEAASVVAPTVSAVVDTAQWDRRAAELGGTSNVLVAAVSARLGRLRGRADEAGRVTLNFPVAERTESDTRANALTGVTVTADTAELTTSLAALRADIKNSLKGLAAEQHKLLAAVPLTPITPKRLLRKLEGVVMGAGYPVGCTNVGDVDPAINRIDGTEADFFWARMVEWPITADILDRMGGFLVVASFRVNGRITVSASGWQAGADNSRDRLAEQLRQVLDEFGLSATLV